MVVLIFASAWLHIELHRVALESQSRTSSDNLARAFEEHVVATVNSIDQLALNIQRDYRRDPIAFDFARAAESGQLLLGSSGTILATADADGLIVRSSIGRIGFSIADREHFTVHRDRPDVGLFIGKPVVARGPGRRSIQFTRRLDHSDGSFAGIVTIGVDPDYFTSFDSSIAVAGKGAVALVGMDGVIRARLDGNDRAVGQSIAESILFKLVAETPTGRYVSRDAGGGGERVTESGLDPALAAAIEAADREVLRTGRSVDREQHYVGRAGEPDRHLLVTKTPIFDAAGKAIQVLTIGTDITAMKRAEDALRNKTKVLDAALAATPDAISVIDTDLRAAEQNDRFFELFDIDKAAALAFGDPVAYELREMARRGEYGPGDPDELARRRLTDAAQLVGEQGSYRYERRLQNSRWVESRLSAMEGGGWISLHRDVTKRKRTEQALKDLNATLERRIEERTQALAVIGADLVDAVESVDQGIVLYDKDDRVIVFNQLSREHFSAMAGVIATGVRFEDMFRTAVDRGAIVVPAGRDKEAFIAERVVRHLNPDATPLIRRLADGRVLRVVERRSRNGGIIATGVDITEQMKLEQQLREAQKMAAIGRLTGGMAHDFNNYLGVIIGNLDLLDEGGIGDPDAGRHIAAALGGALRGAELTRSLLAFSRRQPLNPQLTSLNSRIEAIGTLLTSTLREALEVATVLAPDLWPVKVDGAQLDSSIVNLAGNARDAMPGGGRLTIATRNVHLDDRFAAMNEGGVAGDYALIEISDTGMGMSSETLARIFEPFFTTKEAGHGTGLGLSMVYGFVKQSEGYITVESEVGHGTKARIYLPRVHGAAVAGSSVTAVSTPSRGALETVLVVDDNAAVRHTAEAQLTSLGYRVIAAENGDAALAILDQRDRHVDLLFTDVVMPGKLDGYALAGLALERRPGIKLLLTSGFTGDRSARPETHMPTLRVLGKPYRRSELAAALRETLASS